MSLETFAKTLGLLGGIAMPFCNIPLITRIIRRKSSQDISLAWVLGVEACVLAMLPAAFLTQDPVLRVFGITNSFFFTLVTAVVWIYHS